MVLICNRTRGGGGGGGGGGGEREICFATAVINLWCLLFLVICVDQSVWSGILNTDTVEDSVDFFNAGAGSMDVTR